MVGAVKRLAHAGAEKPLGARGGVGYAGGTAGRCDGGLRDGGDGVTA